MIRRIGVLVFAVAIVLAACGRQVTGLNSPGGVPVNGGNQLPAGQMLLRFRTAAAMDFTNFRYIMVFNTSGMGGEPYSNAFTSGFLNYSYAWVVGGSGGAVGQPQLVQYYLQTGTGQGLGSRTIPYPLQDVQFNANSNGNFTEFTLIFNRALFNQPNPTATQAAAPATPTPLPTVMSTNWFLNYITTDPATNPIDAEGVQGKNDTSFVLPLDTTQYLDYVQQLTVPVGAVQLSSSQQPAQITGGEVINAP